MKSRINTSIARRIGSVTLAVVLVLAATQTIMAPTETHAQSPQGTITVVGEGKVRIKPDMAQVTIGVEVIKPTVKDASAETTRIMNEVLAVLKNQGLADADIQTSSVSVWMERPYLPDGTQGEPIYHVSNQVNANVRNLEKLGDVLDAAMTAGANTIYGVTFGLSDTSKVEAEARQKAVENARTKAESLAQMNGLILGKVINVSEIIGTTGAGYYPGGVQQAMGMGGGGGPVLPGEMEISMQIQIVYATVE
jgi:uncharacterized protein YggE